MGNDLKFAFDIPYIDPYNFVKTIGDDLKDHMKIFMGERADEYIAPYISLITSSMIGKSRLMKQLANYMPVIYLCFRTQNSTGYPPRSPSSQNGSVPQSRSQANSIFSPPISTQHFYWSF